MERPWDAIAMDFTEGFPKFEGFDVILVFMDHLTKYAHSLPLLHPYTSTSHTSHFCRKLLAAVGTNLGYSLAYHPQTDCQSESVKQCLEQNLRAYECPIKWKCWLAMAEFWYNSSYHTSFCCSPFQALYGNGPNFVALPNLGVVADSDTC